MINFIVRFWYGKIDLWKSYWLVGELLNALVFLIIINLEIRFFKNINSGLPAINGIITSGTTVLPCSSPTITADSKIALACISYISGYEIPNRQPRWPSMGLYSCSWLALWRNPSNEVPVTIDSCASSSSDIGKNSAC